MKIHAPRAFRRTVRDYWFIYATGSVSYAAIETVYRGHTHFTMVILGGLCGVVLYRIDEDKKHPSLLIRTVTGALTVTLLEFLTGCIVNLGLGLDVWDYSGEPLNLLGQICPSFSFVWFLLCFPAFGIFRLTRRFLFPYLDPE